MAGVGKLVAGADGGPVVLSDRPDVLVVRVGDVVVKAHPPGTDAAALAARLRVAVAPRLGDILLPPLAVPSTTVPFPRGPRPGDAGGGCALFVRVRDRLVTVWPAGEPVNPEEPHAAPWEEAARLLARLHSVPVSAVAGPGALPPTGGPGRVARAMARLRIADGTPAAAEVCRAFARLPPWARGAAPPAAGALVHGDWHLGQLVRWPAGPGGAGGWRLIDVDDLGVGDPAWDLARPAGWYAAGLLPPEVWQRFLSAYRASGGRAVPPHGDPWPVLDVPARALVIQAAALGVAAAAREGRPLDDVEEALVEACRRITRTSAAC
ncbi:hypothetical protein TH66_10540 [Carbonactinospora thermoautotrophica]|uniref:Aminoglycoside phosphotransferase domain-containing protein n=1 Tax=Carbonactinospora thermoautotrophica TaxID=1469144 RepID=A0A132N110_9ACTN|nr:hypothetical protein TH66_10540 [Carbonactinospora thermoautotrophica]